ncbi:Pentatricopeptide repeat-containing protein [Nymphaea thermarum]|nr:Pentatricopeptide repeat-containing protein [Nymphaea thermarum]
MVPGRATRNPATRAATNSLLRLPFSSLPSTAGLESPSLSLLKECTTIRQFKEIHAHSLRHHLQNGPSLLSKLASLRLPSYAFALLFQLPRPDDFSWNVVIRSLARAGRFVDAIGMFRRMKSSGHSPSNFSFPPVFASYGSMAALLPGSAAHADALKLGWATDAFTQHALITMYGRCGRVDYARQVFGEMPLRDVVSWNAIIAVLAQNDRAREAVEVFGRMREAGFVPDEPTLVSVLSACGELGDVTLGSSLESYAANRGLLSGSNFIGSALVGMYGKCGRINDARRTFDAMSKRDAVAWNAMIAGYSQNGRSTEAIESFLAMREAGIEPDKVTLAAVLPACAAANALDLGMFVDSYAAGKGLKENVFVATALVDMYAKCGMLDHARRLFDAMPERNVVSWNTMISALAMHGRGKEAIDLFRLMREVGMRPNEITFVGVLSACVHIGFVEEGRQFFDSMQRKYGIAPGIEHCTCMVDLLARAGRLVEAFEFVETMPVKPDAVVWGALLGASRNQKDAEMGERIMQRLLELEPENSGNYVMVSSMYVTAKRWEDAGRIRGMMREQGVVKTPGCSWVEIDDLIHEFRSGDVSHVRWRDIHALLQKLTEEMKVEGYRPMEDLIYRTPVRTTMKMREKDVRLEYAA